MLWWEISIKGETKWTDFQAHVPPDFATEHC